MTTQNIRDAILKLKKKHSNGTDQLCGMHLVHGSPSLINHLELFYQMIFNCEQVLDVFVLESSHLFAKRVKIAPIACRTAQLLFLLYCAS